VPPHYTSTSFIDDREALPSATPFTNDWLRNFRLVGQQSVANRKT
jgi:hypothetical protein